MQNLSKICMCKRLKYDEILCKIKRNSAAIGTTLQHAMHTTDFTSLKCLKEMPEPKGHPIFGTLLDYTSYGNFNFKNLAEHFRKRHQNLGSIYKEYIFPNYTSPYVQCTSAEDNRVLFQAEERIAYREAVESMVVSRRRMGLSIGLPFSQGEEWYRMRQVVNRHFLKNSTVWSHAQEQYKVAEDLVKYINENLDHNKEVLHLNDALQKWAFESTGVFCFGMRLGIFDTDADEDLDIILETNRQKFLLIAETMFSPPLWKLFNTRLMKKLISVQFNQLAAIERQREKIMNNFSPSPELARVTRLFKNSKLTKSEVDMLIMDLLAGGIDTTSNAAIFMLYTLAINPDKQELLRKEILEVLESGKTDGKDLMKMTYLHACILETQRMFPFSIGTNRRYSKDVVLSGYRIPAGTTVILTSNLVNGRNPSIFSNPDTFLPERWLNNQDNEAKDKMRFAMAGSFGHGTRACPGRKFALQEIKYLLISLLSRYKVEYHYAPMTINFLLVSTPSEKPRFTFNPI